MATYQARGIVLKRTNLGEADKIVTFFTLDHGTLRAVARGVRRIKSKMAGHLEPFSLVELVIANGKSLDVITSARLLKSREDLLKRYDTLPIIFLLGELVDKLTAEAEPQPDIFHLLSEALEALERNAPPLIVELGYKLRLLAALGHRPELDACVVCHQKEAAAEYWFSPSLGGITDQSCREAGSVAMSQRAIKLWRLMQHNPLVQVAAVQGAALAAAESLPICDEFYEYTFGRKFRPKVLV